MALCAQPTGDWRYHKFSCVKKEAYPSFQVVWLFLEGNALGTGQRPDRSHSERLVEGVPPRFALDSVSSMVGRPGRAVGYRRTDYTAQPCLRGDTAGRRRPAALPESWQCWSRSLLRNFHYALLHPVHWRRSSIRWNRWSCCSRVNNMQLEQ